MDAEKERIQIERAVAGDEEAFAALYGAYVDRIYGFIAFRVSNNQTAEDLTSQVFLKAWEALDSYEPRGVSFGAWLFRIARNTVIDHYRTKKEPAPLDTVAETTPAQVPAVDVQVERHLTARELQRALGQLTELQREVLTLKFIVGLETREVAEIMGKRQGAIRALQMRGLQALERILSPDAYA